MKEFLEPLPNGDFRYHKDSGDMIGGDWIEIPSSADTYLELNKRNLAFYKDNFKYCYLNDSEGWVKTDGCSEAFTHFKALWKRQSMANPKEYLFKGIDGTYKVVDHDCRGLAIEIPEGADFYAQDSMYGVKKDYFFKNKTVFEQGSIFIDGMWHRALFDINFRDVHWQRHTQPEELPFMDDGLTDATAFIQSNMDQVNHPQHYTSGSIECIDAIESSMTKEAFAGYLKGNVQKYMWRYENKGGVESLQKAQWYLNRLILLQSA